MYSYEEFRDLQDLENSLEDLQHDLNSLIDRNKEVKRQIIEYNMMASKREANLKAKVQKAEYKASYNNGIYYQEMGRKNREGFKGFLIEKLKGIKELFPKISN